MSEPMKYPAFEEERPLKQVTGATSPETGKTYSGRIVALNDTYVVQDAGSDQRLLRHSRQDLSGGAVGALAVGQNVEIRYAANRVGIVREWGVKQLDGGASKGLAVKGLGD